MSECTFKPFLYPTKVKPKPQVKDPQVLEFQVRVSETEEKTLVVNDFNRAKEIVNKFCKENKLSADQKNVLWQVV
jgi:hypothetical protein